MTTKQPPKPRGRRPLPILERLMRHVLFEPNTGCWLWSAFTNSAGYGTTGKKIGDGHTMALAHRVSWEVHRGEIPKDIHVLHRCDTPACVNPDHLFLGTNNDNIADRVSKGRSKNFNTGRTHCKRGHEFTPENTYHVVKRSLRQCRICARMHGRIHDAKRRNKGDENVRG